MRVGQLRLEFWCNRPRLAEPEIGVVVSAVFGLRPPTQHPQTRKSAMPIDIRELRVDQGGDPERWREFQRKRFKDADLVDRVLELDSVRPTPWHELRGSRPNAVARTTGKRKSLMALAYWRRFVCRALGTHIGSAAQFFICAKLSSSRQLLLTPLDRYLLSMFLSCRSGAR